MNQKLFTKDFTLVVIGQIISLFGNAAVRFALPLYLLNQTGSSALYGTVTACALIPAILLSPIGGIAADRVNKRNVMVILDFFTAAVILTFSILLNAVNLVFLLTVTLMILYGIAGAYQPSVQASIPALVSREHIMQANSIINMISSLASLAGPVLGGIFYAAYGLKPVLWICILCFFLSAVMELFIRIPFVRQDSGGAFWKTVTSDFSESMRFVWREKPEIGKVVLLACGINLFLSSMILVGMPYLITEVLGFETGTANRLYGFAEGAMAAGGLLGGICAGVFGGRLPIQKAGNLIIAGAAAALPMGAALGLFSSAVLNYAVMAGCCFAITIVSTIFTIQMMAFVQTETPQNLIGKVIAVILTLSMCAQPLGNAFYGFLFEICAGAEFAVVLFAGGISLVIAVLGRRIFMSLSGKTE